MPPKDKPIYSSHDIEWDEDGIGNGYLYIKDDDLAKLVAVAIQAKKFGVQVKKKDSTDGGGIGEQKVNVMCLC
jgi:hypothetical protein